MPETEEFGVTSYVYRARKPFVPAAIHLILSGPLPGVIRAKGHFWIATRPSFVAEFSLGGALSSVSPLGTWWAAVPKERWPDHESARKYLAERWQQPWGHRRQEIVFIASGIEWPALEARFNAALLPDDFGVGIDAPPHLPDLSQPGTVRPRPDEGTDRCASLHSGHRRYHRSRSHFSKWKITGSSASLAVASSALAVTSRADRSDEEGFTLTGGSPVLRLPAESCRAAVGSFKIRKATMIVAAELLFGAAKSGSTRLLQQVSAILSRLPVQSIKPPADEVYAEARIHLGAPTRRSAATIS